MSRKREHPILAKLLLRATRKNGIAAKLPIPLDALKISAGTVYGLVSLYGYMGTALIVGRSGYKILQERMKHGKRR